MQKNKLDDVSIPNLPMGNSIEPDPVGTTQTNPNIGKTIFFSYFFFNSKHLSIYLYICIFYVVELLEEIPLPGEFMTRQCMETTLPRYFSWTINESLGIVYCQSYTNLNQTCFIKTVRFDTTDKVSFLLNGKKFHHKE
jgi:hypothetical protein